MQDFLFTLLACSVTVSALAVLYMALMPLLAKRYSEKGRYYTWLVFVVGLIVPFRPRFGSAVVNVSVPAQAAAPVIQIGNGAPVAIVIPVPGSGGNAAMLSVAAGIPWWQIAALIWMAGAAVFLLFHAVRHLRFMKMAARWSEPVTDGRALAAFQDLRAELGISKQMEICSCSVADSPMIAGFARPRILIPSADLAHDELLFILKHELIHYKRKDLYYKCLTLLAASIHWFNPVVYLIVRAVESGCELSCDAEVVKRTDAATRRQYTETIIGAVRYKSKMKTAFSINYSGGLNGMKKRLFSIMDARPKKLGAFILCVAVAAVAVSGSLLAYTAPDVIPLPDPVSDPWPPEDTLDSPGAIPDYSYMNDYPAGTFVIVTEPGHIRYVPDHLNCVYVDPADYGCETAEELMVYLNESKELPFHDPDVSDKPAVEHITHHNQWYWTPGAASRAAEMWLNETGYAKSVADLSDVYVTIANITYVTDPSTVIVSLWEINGVRVEAKKNKDRWPEADIADSIFTFVRLTKADGVWETVSSTEG